MTLQATSRQTSVLMIVVVAGIVLSLCMGMRQSLGLFLRPINQDLAVSATAFGFAIALQNLVWGISQPFVGMMGDRYGARPVLIACGLIYAAGLSLMAWGGPVLGLNVGAGLLIGIGISGTGFGVVLGAASRAVRPEKRMQTLGLVSAAGSVSTLALAPVGQVLISDYGWQTALMAFAAIAVIMAAVGGLIGAKPSGKHAETAEAHVSPWIAISCACRHPGFLAMTVAFFACGFQLAYITTHLPTFLAICGVPASVSATALGVIGAANAIGSYTAGLLGARFSQKRLLSLAYLLRTITIACFLATPITAFSTIIFAAVMGFLWLGVVPLVSGLISRMFGLQNFNTLFGVTFFSHQLGSFSGAWLGGLSYDLSGSYSIAWGSMIAIGIGATLIQWFMKDSAASPPPATTAIRPIHVT